MQLVDVQVWYSLLLDMFFLQIQIQNKYMKNVSGLVRPTLRRVPHRSLQHRHLPGQNEGEFSKLDLTENFRKKTLKSPPKINKQ